MGTLDWLFLLGTVFFFGYMMLVYKIMEPITRMDEGARADFARKTKRWRTAGAGIGCAYLVLLAVYVSDTLVRWFAD